MITIERVVLENFLSHAKTEVKFEGQTTVIVGQNGAGKTSILDAVLFALFRKVSRKVEQGELIKKGAKQAKISLELRNGQDKISIVRIISPGSSIADYLSINGQVKVRSARDVTKFVTQVLGLDEKALMSTVFIAQGDVESIVENFEDVFKKLIKIEKIEDLRSSDGPIKAFMDKLQEKINEAEVAKRVLASINADLERLKARSSALIAGIEAKRKTLQELESELMSLEQRLEELRMAKEEFLRLDNELKSVTATISDYRRFVEENAKYVEEIPDIQDIDHQLQDVENRLRGKELYDKTMRDYNSYRKELEETERQISEISVKLEEKRSLKQVYDEYVNLLTLKKKLEKDKNSYIEILSRYNDRVNEKKELESELQKLPKVNPQTVAERYKKVEEEIGKTNARLGEVTGLIEKKREDLAKVQSAVGKCPLCGSPLTEEHKSELIRSLNAEIDQLTKEKKELEGNLNALKKELDRLKEEQKEAVRIAERLSQLRQKLDRVNRDLSVLIEQLSQLEPQAKKYEEVSRRLTDLEPSYQKYLSLSSLSEEHLAQLEKKREEYLSRVRNLEAELESLKPYSNEDVQTLKSRLQELTKLKEKALKLLELKNKVDIYREKLRELEEKKRELEGKIKELSFDAGEYEKIETRVNELRRKTSELKGAIAAMESELAAVRDDIAKKEDDKKKYEEKVASQEKLAIAFEKLRRLRDALSESRLQSFLMASAKDLLERYLNDIANYFDLKYSALEIVQESGLEIYGYLANGQRIPISAMSGGERVSVSISLRLALARLMKSNVGFVVMDEPTVHLDDYRRKELLEVIRKASEIIPQIILVTHDEELKDAGDEVIRVELEGDTSRVRVETND